MRRLAVNGSSYTPKGLTSLMKDGGSKRKENLGMTVKGMNGTLETPYFAFGEDDVYSIVDVPDKVSAVTSALTINASGAAQVKTVVLISPERIDEATKIDVSYRSPNHNNLVYQISIIE
jgi:uncharacterized protein with GYD domain